MVYPTIGVIMSVYKNDTLSAFQRAIHSLVSQDYPFDKIRVYLGIDGPVPADIDNYITNNRRLFYKIVRSSVNVGLGRTLNRLIESLSDEMFVFRMDADDVSLNARFRKQVEYMLAHPHIDILGTALTEVDETGVEQGVRYYPSDETTIKVYVAKACPLAHPTVCFRKSVFEKVSGYPEYMRYSQDIALWFVALARGARIANLSDPLYQLTVSKDFFRRRGATKALVECGIYIRGIWNLHGLTFRYVYPIARLVVRFMPLRAVQLIYSSRARSLFLNATPSR